MIEGLIGPHPGPISVPDSPTVPKVVGDGLCFPVEEAHPVVLDLPDRLHGVVFVHGMRAGGVAFEEMGCLYSADPWVDPVEAQCPVDVLAMVVLADGGYDEEEEGKDQS